MENQENITEAKFQESIKEFARFIRLISARGDLAEFWFMGAFGILSLFKQEKKELITTYIETANTKFFQTLKLLAKKEYPDQKFAYNLGTVCSNGKGAERLITGIKVAKNSKPVYQYLDDDGNGGACNESSMVSWMEKN